MSYPATRPQSIEVRGQRGFVHDCFVVVFNLLAFLCRKHAQEEPGGIRKLPVSRALHCNRIWTCGEPWRPHSGFPTSEMQNLLWLTFWNATWNAILNCYVEMHVGLAFAIQFGKQVGIQIGTPFWILNSEIWLQTSWLMTYELRLPKSNFWITNVEFRTHNSYLWTVSSECIIMSSEYRTYNYEFWVRIR